MVVHTNDALVLSRTVQEHLQHLKKALQHVLEEQWRIKA